jgi:peptide/nickel transport system permease protein
VKRFPYLRAALRKPSGALGAAILTIVLIVAFVGRFLAPHNPTETLGIAGAPPGNGFALGTDYLGRDVLSRVLYGGLSVVLMAVAATLTAYLIGLAIGVVAGYIGGRTDMVLMRGVDVILAFPPLMVILLLVGGLNNHIWVLILGVIVVQVPSIARISRAAAQAISRSEFVDAARSRGDSLPTVWRKDVLTNISSTVLSDFGIRFGVSIILIASVNYLGLGLNPPASDWGLMISENQDFISLNPYSVLIPALMLALITIGVNLFADCYVRCVHAGSSSLGIGTDVAPEISVGSGAPPTAEVAGIDTTKANTQ